MSLANMSSAADMPMESPQVMMMTPYLHFTGGDYLFLGVWRPSSPGAIAGVCIFLAVLAFFDRWLSATRTMLETYWRRRALASTTARDDVVITEIDEDASGSNDERYLVRSDTRLKGEARNPASPDLRSSLKREPETFIMQSRKRTFPPFVAAHDIPRGILFALQMTVMYLLMLAIMTFQAAFLISIILGLGLGEVAFGRIAAGRRH